MTVSFTFSLSGDPGAILAPDGSVFPVFPITGARVECNGASYDITHFLELFSRIFPPEYLAPMLQNPDAGYEIFRAMAAVGERVSTAIERLECGSFISFASGGIRTRVYVTFTRAAGSPASTFTIQQGTVVRTSRHSRRFVVVEDMVFDAGDPEVSVLVEAVADGYEYNVSGTVLTPSGILLEGEIDTIETLYLDPPHVTDELEVSQQLYPHLLGKTADLDGLAANRGVFRFLGEDDESLRLRTKTITDSVSIDAIRRLVERFLGAYSDPLLPYDIVETFERRYQDCWDAPSPNIGTPTGQGWEIGGNNIGTGGVSNVGDQWEIIGPDAAGAGIIWVRRRMLVAGSADLPWSCDTSDSPLLDFDWPFFFVTQDEVVPPDAVLAGSSPGNIVPSADLPVPASGTVTITWDAGDYIYIGVYASDGIGGPATLDIDLSAIPTYPSLSAVFVYDDPRPVVLPEHFGRNRWLDDVEFRATFVVVLPFPTTAEQAAMYAALYAEVQRVKAAGVAAIFETPRS